MKKALLILAVLLCLIFSGCGGGRPKDLSDAHYQYGKRALEIVDDCLDFTIDLDTAYDKLEQLQELEDTLPPAGSTEGGNAANFSVEGDLVIISSKISLLRLGAGDMQELLEVRNNLAEDIGEKTR